MVARPESYQVSVVGRCRDRHRAGAPNIGVAQLKGQLLQFISIKSIVIPKHMVVTWPRGTLDSLVGAKIEIKLCGVGDANVNCRAGRDVA